MELEAYVFETLEKVGIQRGHIVLDFGCGSGTYTLPAAEMVGNRGRVYAVDKDRKVLDELMQRAESEGLRNIVRMDTSVEPGIELPDESTDVILLFDVFHSYYFSRVADRRELLDEVYRILKPGGLLSVYPKHMESEARAELENANFYVESEFSGTLVHNSKDLEKGQVLNFRKKILEVK